jgi:CRISPR-associated protein Csb2
VTNYLTIGVRLLDGRFHGRSDNGRAPEWPPSPMRLFQALVAGAAPRWVRPDVPRGDERAAFLWLEGQPPPIIVAPRATAGATVLTYVPNNNDPGKNERTPKFIQPMLVAGEPVVEYCYQLSPDDPDAEKHAAVLCRIARHVRCLGWGIDMAVGWGRVGTIPVLAARCLFQPGEFTAGGDLLRAPQPGSLVSLEAAHRAKGERFAQPGRLALENAQPTFREVVYSTTLARPYCAFAFVDANDVSVTYSVGRIKELAGHLRHIIKGKCAGMADEIVNGMILGHPKTSPRLSILPVPSVGHPHSDGLIRRVILAEPAGTDRGVCRHLRDALEQAELSFEGNCPCPRSILTRCLRSDSMVVRFVRSARSWASVTPVLLPGHNVRGRYDHAKSIARAHALVEKSLQQAGVMTPATFEVSPVPYWPGTQHARAYQPREKLAHNPRFHVRINFETNVSGPLSIGAGRHVGFGTLAALDTPFPQR